MNCSGPPSDEDLVLETAGSDDPLTPWDPWNDRTLCVGTLGSADSAPQAAFASDTLFDMMGHGSDRTDREVGGILLGDFVQTPRGPLTRVADIIIADSNEASLTHVTFTHDAWERIHTALDVRDDDLRIVGWYHTHPGFGPFLSAHDRFIHENFFAHPRHVALVLDPVQCLIAVFSWCGSTVERLPGCLLYDDATSPEELQRLLSELEYSRECGTKRKGILSWLSR